MPINQNKNTDTIAQALLKRDEIQLKNERARLISLLRSMHPTSADDLIEMDRIKEKIDEIEEELCKY
jgi:hypothetical protein